MIFRDSELPRYWKNPSLITINISYMTIGVQGSIHHFVHYTVVPVIALGREGNDDDNGDNVNGDVVVR